jgi:hypothetical protein
MPIPKLAYLAYRHANGQRNVDGEISFCNRTFRNEHLNIGIHDASKVVFRRRYRYRALGGTRHPLKHQSAVEDDLRDCAAQDWQTNQFVCPQSP